MKFSMRQFNEFECCGSSISRRGLIGFGGVFICVGVALHLAYSKMDLMLEHLKNCSAVMIQAPLRNGGS
jgi:urea transporter